MRAPQEISEEVAEAIAAEFAASFDDAETTQDPHTLKGGSFCPPQESKTLPNTLVLLTNERKVRAGLRVISGAKHDQNGGQNNPPRRHRAKTSGDEVRNLFDAFRFDWFQGVLPASDGSGECIPGGEEEHKAHTRATAWAESVGMRIGRTKSGGLGYHAGLPLYWATGKRQVGSIVSGGKTGVMPCVLLSGGDGLCAVLAPTLQQAFPGIRPTRVDVSLDVQGAANAFKALVKTAEAFAVERKIKMERKGTAEAGETLYLGSRESPVILRIYEKGKQMNGAAAAETYPEGWEPFEAPKDWVRIEFQFSDFKGHAKAQFGQMKPGEIILAHRWPRLLMARFAAVLGLTKGVPEIAPVKITGERPMKCLETAMVHGARQYGPTYMTVAFEMAAQEDGRAATALTEDETIKRAAALIAEEWRRQGTAKAMLERQRAGHAETAEERHKAFAEAQRSAAERNRQRQAEAYAKAAKWTAEASQNADTITETAEASTARQEALLEYAGDLHRIAAEAEVIRKKKAGAEVIPFPPVEGINPAHRYAAE